MVDLSGIVLADSDGHPVRLGDLIDRPTVIDRVRYYGCPPCRAHLVELADARPDGVGVIGVGPRAAFQARALARRVGVPLLLDPDHRLASAIGQERQPLWRFLFDLRGWWRWLRSLTRSRQGMITSGWWELPAVVVVDADARVRWLHRGRFMGDYPDVSDVLKRARRVAAEGGGTRSA
jgi:hypothetical protein